jgi:hypothetical protein
MKNRLPDPSEICALEFKGEFRRFEICAVSATIGINPLTPRSQHRASSSAQKDRRHTTAFAPVASGVFLYYPDRRQIMPKLRAFVDHVIELLTE